MATVKRSETRDTTSPSSEGGSSLVKIPRSGTEINPCLVWFFSAASKSIHSRFGVVTGEEVGGGIEYPGIDRALTFNLARLTFSLVQ